MAFQTRYLLYSFLMCLVVIIINLVHLRLVWSQQQIRLLALLELQNHRVKPQLLVVLLNHHQALALLGPWGRNPNKIRISLKALIYLGTHLASLNSNNPRCNQQRIYSDSPREGSRFNCHPKICMELAHSQEIQDWIKILKMRWDNPLNRQAYLEISARIWVNSSSNHNRKQLASDPLV